MDSREKYPGSLLSKRSSETELGSPFLGEVFTEAQLPELANLKTPSDMLLQESPFLNVFENTALGLDESEAQEFEDFLNNVDDEFEDVYFHAEAEEKIIDSLDEGADFIDEDELEEAYEDSEEGDSQEEDESEASIGNDYEDAVEPNPEEPPFLHYDAEFPEFDAMSASNSELDELELGLVGDELLETGIHGLSDAETSEADLGTTGDRYFSEDSEFDTEQETPFLPEADAFAEEVWSKSSDQTDFRDRVLAAHIKRSRKDGRAPKPNLKKEQLKPVDGTKISMRRDAAEAASKMLGAARSALASAQVNGHPDAIKTSVLTATSGYRSSDHQRGLWLRYFKNYYNRTRRARESLPDGLHSGQAVSYMLEKFGIPKRIAAPGYSNHQGGIAIDLEQLRSSGPQITNSYNSAAQKRWRDTWFYTWLEVQANAERFGFNKPLKGEPWHWVYKPSQISNNPATQDSRGNPMFSLPRQLSEAVRKGLFSLRVALSILSGQRDEKTLTNMIFNTRHPELPRSYKIAASEKALAREWIDIRNNSVRPVLRMFHGSASTTVPSANTTTSVSSSSTAPRVAGIDPKVVERIDHSEIRDLIERAANAHGMDAHLIRGIIAAESGGNTDAGKGTNGYKGLMQCEKCDDQLNPATSIQFGVKKYKKFERNIKNFFIARSVDWERLPVESQIELIMASYNAGPFTLKKAARYAVKVGRTALEWERPEFFQRALLYTGAYSIRVAAKKCGVEKGEDGKRKIAEANGERLRFRNVGFKTPSPAGEMLDPGPTIEEAHERGAPALMICALKFKAQNNFPYRKKILAYRKHFASRS